MGRTSRALGQYQPGALSPVDQSIINEWLGGQRDWPRGSGPAPQPAPAPPEFPQGQAGYYPVPPRTDPRQPWVRRR